MLRCCPGSEEKRQFLPTPHSQIFGCQGTCKIRAGHPALPCPLAVGDSWENPGHIREVGMSKGVMAFGSPAPKQHTLTHYLGSLAVSASKPGQEKSRFESLAYCELAASLSIPGGFQHLNLHPNTPCRNWKGGNVLSAG